MRLADAGTLCLFARIFITPHKYRIITQITLILRSVSGSSYVTRLGLSKTYLIVT